MPRLLFIGIGDDQQIDLAKSRADDRQANRQVMHIAHRYSQVGIAGNRRVAGAAAADEMIAVDAVNHPRDAATRCDQRVQLMGFQ